MSRHNTDGTWAEEGAHWHQSTLTPRDIKIEAASDPIPSSVERGPVARAHWRHGLANDEAFAATVVDTADTPAEWSSVLAETHASLLDPQGSTPLPSPSPLGVAVSEALRGTEAWAPLCDAARAHPMIAREAVGELAGAVLDALKSAGAKPDTDTRVSLADLEAARRALDEAREALKRTNADPKATREQLRDAQRAVVDARAKEERAEANANRDAGIARRTGAALSSEETEAIVAGLAAKAEGRAHALHAYSNAAGSGAGIGGSSTISDAVVKALTPEIVKILEKIGALRKALQAGRAARHVRGREGMKGQAHGGLADVADLTALALAGVSGMLGPEYAALTTLALVEGRADVIEKGGGIARNGHVLLVADQSGSTAGARQQWIAALCLSVALEARADGRTVGLVTFSDRVTAEIVIDSPASFVAALKALTSPDYGGTDVRAALAAAARLLARMPHGGEPSDVLLVTDGAFDASEAAGFPETSRLRACFIGGSAPAGIKLASAWEVRAVDGKEGDAAALEIAQTIV